MFGGGGSKLMNLKVACVLILERVLFSNNFSEESWRDFACKK